VTDYEVGTKVQFFDRKLSFDASVYHIKHDDIQAGIFSEEAKIYYSGNAGSARSDGIELSTELRPITGLLVASWVAFNDSKVSIPPSSALAYANGGPLGLSPKWSGNLSLDQDFPVGASVTGFAGAAVTYIGNRSQAFPAYTRADLHAGINYGDWTTRLYINNAANRLGLINGGPSTLIADSYYYITPRTIGVNVSRKF
jgi:iron complex outermembrane receptor protein